MWLVVQLGPGLALLSGHLLWSLVQLDCARMASYLVAWSMVQLGVVQLGPFGGHPSHCGVQLALLDLLLCLAYVMLIMAKVNF